MASPIVIAASSTVTATGATLVDYRRRLADELGFLQVTTVSTTATQGDATRVILADELRDDEAGYDYLGMPWVYVQNGDQAGTQRRIISQPDVGYQGEAGALVLSRPFAAAVAAGSTIEITSPLPVKRHLSVKGLHDCINEALARIWIVVRLAVTGNGTYEYDLGAYPALIDPDQIRSLDDTFWAGSSFPAEPSPFDYRIVSSGASRTLLTETLYGTDTTFNLNVFVRADRYVFDGAGWSFVTTPGLLNDTYQAAVSEDMVVAFAMVKALQAVRRMLLLDTTMDKQLRSELLSENGRRTMTYARLAARIKRETFPKPVPVPRRGLITAPSLVSWP